MHMSTEHTEWLHQPQNLELPEPGRFLLLSRPAWVVLVGLSLLIFLASLPAYLTQLQTICLGTNCQDLQLNQGFGPPDWRAQVD